MSLEVQLAKELYEYELKRKEHEDIAEDFRAKYLLTQKKLIDVLVEEGKTSTGHIEGVGEISLKKANYPSVNKSNMPVFMQWLRDTGSGALIKEVVDSNTLKKFLTQKIDDLAYDIDAVRENEIPQELKIRKLAQLLMDDYSISITPEIASYFNDEDLESDKLAAIFLAELGVHNFTDFKISHVKKGR
jgi:hypothetical protein